MPILTIYTYLFFLLLLYFTFNVYNKNKDIFSPKSFFIIFTLFEIPFAFQVINNINLIHPYARIHIKDFEEVFFIHFFNSSLFLLSVIIALNIFNPKATLLSKIFDSSKYNKNTYLKVHLFLIFICIISFLIFLNSIGGLFYLLKNMDTKSSIIAGTGYLQALYTTSGFLSTGFLIMFYSSKNKINFTEKIYLYLIIIIVFIILAAIGSRKTPILFILFTILMWNYHINKIKLFSLKNILLGIIALLYFGSIPLFRTYGASEFYSSNIDILFLDTFNNMFSFFHRFSELERSLLIYSLFNIDNLWLGRSFQDLLYSPIPRGLFPNKPPLDEGVYIYNIAHGNIVSPSTPLNQMIAVGWPPNTITNMYINFSFIGIIFGGFIYGYFLKYFYNLVLTLNYNPISIYLYSSAIFGNLAITNRNIVSFLTMILFSFILIKIIEFLIRFRK